jgi:tetratricopeptide (TPR) repeat protein
MIGLLESFNSWRMRRSAFNEIRSMVDGEIARAKLDDANPLNRSRMLARDGNLAEARHYLDLARERIPAIYYNSRDTIEVLLAIKDFAEAEKMAIAGMKQYSREPFYAESYAAIAQRKGDFTDGVVRWSAVRKKFQLREKPYSGLAACLRELGRYDEAEVVLREGLRHLPNAIGLRLEYCRMAEAQKDWEEAYRRWSEVAKVHHAGIVGAAQALHKMGRSKEALNLLKEARSRHPIEPSIAILQAEIAETALTEDEAVALWAVVRERFPLERAGYKQGIGFLRKAKLWDNAEKVALEGMSRFPVESWAHLDYAELATARRDWPEASARWRKVTATFPDNAFAKSRVAQAEAEIAKIGAT